MSLLSVEHLTFTYAHGKQPAVDDVSMTFEAGQVTAIIGANGAGKSTLCYALAGFIPHFFRGSQSGTVTLNGIETGKTTLSELVTQVGLVFQNPFNQISGAKLTVEEEVAFGLENLGVPREEIHTRVISVLEQFQLKDAAAQSPYTLSGGQQQRLALASILVMEPSILVLDEPTAQLDPVGTRQVMMIVSALAKHGRTIVWVEHKLEWVADLAQRVLVLEQGKLVADGTPSQVLPHAQQWGLVETRYTRAGRLAQERGLVRSDKPLPLTLGEAEKFFGK